MSKDTFWTTIKADFFRYLGSKEKGLFLKLKYLATSEGLVVLLLFRLIQLTIKLRIPILPIILKIPYWLLTIFFGIRISLDAKIGKGLYIGHYGCIFIGHVEIGDFCNISHEVTIGLGKKGSDNHGYPTIGSFVLISPGAKIFGKGGIHLTQASPIYCVFFGQFFGTAMGQSSQPVQ